MHISVLSIPLPRHEREGGRYAIRLVGFSGGVACLSPFPAALSGSGENSSFSASGSVAGSSAAQTAMLRLPCRLILSVMHAVRLLFVRSPLQQGNFSHMSSEMFRLHAWTLLRSGSEDRDSLRGPPASWLSCYGLQRVLSTTDCGTSSVLGVQRDRSTLSLSL